MMDILGQREIYSGRRMYYTTIKYYDIVGTIGIEDTMLGLKVALKKRYWRPGT
jgi:hypothetical protein